MARFNPFTKRAQRVRTAIRRNAGGRPRLSVHRSGRHIYAQVINDAEGRTVASASTLEKEGRAKTGATVASAQEVGKRLAERAKAASRLSPMPRARADWSSREWLTKITRLRKRPSRLRFPPRPQRRPTVRV